jgi:hypothetical protein
MVTKTSFVEKYARKDGFTSPFMEHYLAGIFMQKEMKEETCA